MSEEDKKKKKKPDASGSNEDEPEDRGYRFAWKPGDVIIKPPPES